LFPCILWITEIVMAEHSEKIATGEQTAADAVTRSTVAGKRAFDILLGAQRVLLDEWMVAGNEMFERARSETHLFNELVSKMAGAHSTNDIKTMWTECSQHQLDFLRRDAERLFRHGERVVQAMAQLTNHPRND
jgi:hypothetical protein